MIWFVIEEICWHATKPLLMNIYTECFCIEIKIPYVSTIFFEVFSQKEKNKHVIILWILQNFLLDIARKPIFNKEKRMGSFPLFGLYVSSQTVEAHIACFMGI